MEQQVVVIVVVRQNDDNGDDNGDDDKAKTVLPKLVLLDSIQSYCNSVSPIMLKFITTFLFLILIFPILTTIIA